MAMYMFFYSVPDNVLEYLECNPAYLGDFLEGVVPTPKQSFVDKLLRRSVEIQLPAGWPASEPKSFEPEINHRMISDFHYILNGSDDFVCQAGCVFQTWLSPNADTVAITIDSENFGLKSDEVSNFKGMLESIYPEVAIERYTTRLNGEYTSEDQEYLKEILEELISACKSAMKSNSGLMWCAC